MFAKHTGNKCAYAVGWVSGWRTAALAISHCLVWEKLASHTNPKPTFYLYVVQRNEQHVEQWGKELYGKKRNGFCRGWRGGGEQKYCTKCRICLGGIKDLVGSIFNSWGATGKGCKKEDVAVLFVNWDELKVFGIVRYINFMVFINILVLWINIYIKARFDFMIIWLFCVKSITNSHNHIDQWGVDLMLRRESHKTLNFGRYLSLYRWSVSIYHMPKVSLRYSHWYPFLFIPCSRSTVITDNISILAFHISKNSCLISVENKNWQMD